MTNLRLTLTATKLILTGFVLLLIVLLTTLIQLSQWLIHAIAVGIKALHQAIENIPIQTARNGCLSGFSPIAILPQGKTRILTTMPILPSSHGVITIHPTKPKSKRGRPKKLAIA